MENTKLTPDIFKQQVLAAHPNAVDSKGVKYADIPANELLDRFLAVNPNAKTSAGIPYADYKGQQSPSSFAEEQAKAKPDGTVVGNAFRGKPLVPATTADVGGEGSKFTGGNPLSVIGKTTANVFSDAPAILKGLAEGVIHPIDAVKGIAQFYSGIAKESFDAIKEGIQTKDWSRVEDDLKKAEINVINHPLQSILAFEGAKGGIKGAVDVAKNPVESFKGAAETVRKVGDAGVQKFEVLKQSMRDKGISFASDTALHKKSLDIADTIGQQVEQQKVIADFQKELESMREPLSKKLKEKTSQVEEKTLEQHQKELALEQAKAQLSDLGKIQKKLVQEASDDTKTDFTEKGFPSVKEMQTGVTDFFKMAKEKIGKGYEENLGNAKVNFDKVFAGINKFQDYLRGISDKKTLSAIQPMVDNLKIRDIVTRYGENDKGLYKQLVKENVDSKLWENMTPEQIRKEYPVLTSENLKGTKNVIEEQIRQNNTDALKNYNTNVNSALKESFRDAIKSEYGEETLARLDETDKKWSELMSNPLVSKEIPTLEDVSKNWDSFYKNAQQFPEGQALVEKVQNFVGKQILDNAKQSSGDYSPTTINNGIKKYGNIMGDEIKGKLQSIINLNNTLTSKISVAKEAVTEQKKSVTTTDKELAKLNEEQKKITADSKKIGNTTDEIISNIKKIKSVDELNQFAESTGKSIKEIRSVILQAIIEKADPRLLEDKTVPFDVEVTGDIIKELKNLGKSEDGVEWKKTNNELLGKEGIKMVKDLETKFDEYNKIKNTKAKAQYKRILEGAFGTLLVAFGHKVWGGLEVFRAFKNNTVPKSDVSGRARTEATKPKKTLREKARTLRDKTSSTILPIIGAVDAQNDGTSE